MTDFSKTLFVCTGNVFRSVISEKLCIQNARQLGLSVQTRSRGTDLYFKTPNPLLNSIVEKKYLISLKGHRAQKLSTEDIMWASAVVCFTPEHQQAVVKLCPSAKNKTFLIYDVTSLDPVLFKDVDYHDVSETNEYLLTGLKALKSAIDKITKTASLSIIIAVYNEEKNIKNILTKLAMQSSSYEVREIIVVSSGSTDKTDKIIQSIQSPLITLVQEKTRNGKVSALKEAVPFISGDYVLLIDGDVDVEDNFVRECFSCIQNKRVPCTGKVIPIPTKRRFFYKLSVVGCEAWNALRYENDQVGTFLYPSGYTMILSRSDFIDGIKIIDKTTINDDGLLSLVLFQRGILFHYCDNLQVYATFPQSFRDFFRQKIRTRLGRRQTGTAFFKKIEKQWRVELLRVMSAQNLIFVITLFIMDALARIIASVKIRFSRNPHIWKPVVTTKQGQPVPVVIPLKE
mgnify:CR=1 FL=1